MSSITNTTVRATSQFINNQIKSDDLISSKQACRGSIDVPLPTTGIYQAYMTNKYGDNPIGSAAKCFFYVKGVGIKVLWANQGNSFIINGTPDGLLFYTENNYNYYFDYLVKRISSRE